MRTFSQGRAARGIAHGLAVAFFWSAVLTGLAAVPAGAQVPTGYATSGGPTVTAHVPVTQSVAVVPFHNISGYRPETFGEEASDAVATQLRDRLLLEILPKADVQIWMRDLGYKPPFSDMELQRLASELEVVLVMTGQVRMARVQQSPEGRYGEVELAVRLFDRMAETATNGAVVKVKGPTSTEAGDEALITKALEEAAFQAVQQMKTRPTVTATVMWAKDTLVFLNVGGRAGVANGMRMVAIRNGQRIGMVQVTEASPIGSYATIIQGPPLRTGDQLRAVYQLPAAVAALSPERIERKQKRWTGMLLAAAALLGVADMGSTARTLTEGNVAAPGFTASNLANGVETGYSGIVILGQLFLGSPSVLMTWTPYSGTEKTRIIGFETIRNEELVDVLSWNELLAQNYSIDFDRGLVIEEVSFAVSTTATGDPSIAFERTFDDYDPENPPTDLGTVASEYDLTIRWVTFPPLAGMRYTYRIRPIIIQQIRLATGLYEWQLERDTEWSSPEVNWITAVAPPEIAGVDVSGTVGTFFFYSPIGADEAVVQVAKDPYNDFPPDKTYQKLIPGVWSTLGELALESTQVDFTQLANLPGDPTILWWRIGGRNRLDTTPARPYPLSLTNDFKYVWSQRQRLIMFTGASRAALHQQRAALRAAALERHRALRRPGTDRVLKAQ